MIRGGRGEAFRRQSRVTTDKRFETADAPRSSLASHLSSVPRKECSSLVSRLSSLVLWVCLWGGCAAEGPPHPPRVQRPVKIDDLTAEQTGRTLRLSFKRPLLAMDGRRLTKPIALRIFRQLTPPGSHSPAPFVAARPWVSLSPRELATYTRGQTVVYDDLLSPRNFSRLLGTTFSFRVISMTRGFRGRRRESDPSNIARIELLNVSPPILHLSLTQIPGALMLSWAAPERGLASRQLPAIAGYRIYRSTSPRLDSYVLLAQTSATQYDDRHFRFSQTYLYRVGALFKSAGYEAASARSKPISITPRDIFPPPAPRGLTAVYTGRSVQLVWKPDVAPDLAGYNVYRQEGGYPPQRLNHELLRTPVFTDRTAKARHQYSYRVTSVSTAHNESRPSVGTSVETQ
jgi:hypothetical protein